MAGYTRQDTANNIANGNVIDADDFDAEYNAVENAFNASAGHKHDGSAGEGAPIEKVGPSQELVVSSTNVNPKTSNTLDLGTNLLQYKDGYFDGTVYQDSAIVGVNAYMTLSDNEIDVSTGGLTLDAAGDITLDADGGDILLKDAGTTFGTFTNDGNNLVVKSGSTTAITLSGADATLAGTLAVTGATTLNGTVTVSGSNNVTVNAGDVTLSSGDLIVGGTITSTGAIAANGGVNGNLTGNVTGTVSSISNHDTGDLSEGSNLYHTTARARAAISATGSLSYNSTTGVMSFTQGNTDTIAEGSSNLYHTTARARGAISVTDAGGDGSLSYNSTSGVITYTGPSAAQVRAHFSAGSGIGISNGSISHSDTSSQTSVNGSGRTYIQDITLDTYGHVTGLSTATETVVNTNTTYSAGGGLSLSGTTFSHTDTSSQGSVNNSNGTVIQDITLDGYGHITGLSSVNLDGRYFTEGESNSRFAYKAGSGSQNFSANNLYATAFYYSSDERLKENILPVTDSLDVIGQLQGVSFDWSETGNHDIGVIAQEVAAIIPEAVVAKDDGFLSVNATPIIAHLIEAVKELKAEVDRLNDKP